MTLERILLYVDERTDLGKQAVDLLAGSPVSVLTVPISGGIPEATYHKARYVGLSEIRALASDIAHSSAE